MNKVKQFILKLPLVGRALRALKKRLTYEPESSAIEASVWINHIFDNDPIQIVQIGSNDGKTKDPLFDLIQKNALWKVLFVEPVPYLFKRLKANYGHDSRFTFERLAVNDGSRQVFYSVNEEAKNDLPDLPVWYDQLNSFDKNNILKHLDGILKPYIEEMEIEGIRLQELLNRNGIQNLDLLHIDTEGYDWKILSQLNIRKYKPTIILYEHRHITIEERRASLNFLKRKYRIYNIGGDFICLSKAKVKKQLLHSILKR